MNVCKGMPFYVANEQTNSIKLRKHGKPEESQGYLNAVFRCQRMKTFPFDHHHAAVSFFEALQMFLCIAGTSSKSRNDRALHVAQYLAAHAGWVQCGRNGYLATGEGCERLVNCLGQGIEEEALAYLGMRNADVEHSSILFVEC